MAKNTTTTTIDYSGIWKETTKERLIKYIKSAEEWLNYSHPDSRPSHLAAIEFAKSILENESKMSIENSWKIAKAVSDSENERVKEESKMFTAAQAAQAVTAYATKLCQETNEEKPK